MVFLNAIIIFSTLCRHVTHPLILIWHYVPINAKSEHAQATYQVAHSHCSNDKKVFNEVCIDIKICAESFEID